MNTKDEMLSEVLDAGLIALSKWTASRNTAAFQVAFWPPVRVSSPGDGDDPRSGCS